MWRIQLETTTTFCTFCRDRNLKYTLFGCCGGTENLALLKVQCTDISSFAKFPVLFGMYQCFAKKMQESAVSIQLILTEDLNELDLSSLDLELDILSARKEIGRKIEGEALFENLDKNLDL